MKLSYQEVPGNRQIIYNIYRDAHGWEKDGYESVHWQQTFLFSVNTLDEAKKICSLGKTPKDRLKNFVFRRIYREDDKVFSVFDLCYEKDYSQSLVFNCIAEFKTESKIQEFFRQPPTLRKIIESPKRTVVVTIEKNLEGFSYMVKVTVDNSESRCYYAKSLESLNKILTLVRDEYANDEVIMK